MWFPEKFTPKAASKTEDALLMWAPPQLLAILLVGLFAPGALGEYALFNGHR